MCKNIFFICFIIALSLRSFLTFSQNDEYKKDGAKMTVADYLAASDKKKNEGDYKEASRFMNGAATWHWEKKEYEKAIEYFLQSIKLNEKVDNQQGIIGIKNNLGMIYADLRQYDLAYQNFTLVLAERRKAKEPVSIIASLINLSVITNNLKEYDKSIVYLQEALDLALKMGDAEQMRSCYGMMAETYEKKGDTKNMLKYFDLYKTFHEKAQSTKINKLKISEEEAKLRARLLEIENRMKDNSIAQQSNIIAEQQKELAGLNAEQQKLHQTMTKREMLLKLTQEEVKVKDLKLKEQQTQAELKDVKQNNIRNILIIAFLAAILIVLILWWQNKQKKKINLLLRQQKQQLVEQTETLHIQAEELAAQADEIYAKNVTLTQTNTVKDKILSIISHDLRSPLSMIVGFLDLLESGDLDKDETLTLVYQLKNSTNNTLMMLDNLLGWARSQMQGIVATPSVFNLTSLAEEKLELLNEIAKNKEITLVNAIKPNQMVKADKNQIGVVLQNLITNAIKFTHKGGFVTLDTVTNQEEVMVRISDTGIGMSKEDLAKLFQIEINFTSKGTANEKGTGLGLLLCKEFVEKNGGKILVDSKENEGTTFSFTVKNAA
jgi:signal transduction histidine kinase